MPLDEIIHQPIRLRLMAALTALPFEAQVEFTTLKNLLHLTDGNLSVHLHKLEDAGYITMVKIFVNRKPSTYIAATTFGKIAFTRYKEELEKIFKEPEQIEFR